MRTRRSDEPRPLLEAAITAARQLTGAGPLAVLLERDDEDAILAEYLADTPATA